MLMTFWLPLLGIKFGPYDWLMMAGANDTKSTRERKPFFSRTTIICDITMQTS